MATSVIIRAMAAVVAAGAAVISAAPAGAGDGARRVLYVANWGTDNVSAFQVADYGALIPGDAGRGAARCASAACRRGIV
jgi:hypothetical protein